ncbi:hypothetical protein F5Y05DRAFT_409247 [Hypoxylon sp. FL0543]|nr:hypothetical protein F5Y05DRAFT_409247 [Hypoxylon sp. FL0543]
MADSPLFDDDDVAFSHLLDEMDDLDSPATPSAINCIRRCAVANSPDAPGAPAIPGGKETDRYTASNCTGEEDDQRASALVYSASGSNDD